MLPRYPKRKREERKRKSGKKSERGEKSGCRGQAKGIDLKFAGRQTYLRKRSDNFGPLSKQANWLVNNQAHTIYSKLASFFNKIS